MKPSTAPFLGALLVAAVWMTVATRAEAQATSVLHTFNDGTVANDGIESTAGLIQGSDGNFYGTSYSGGSTQNTVAGINGSGTVFKVTPQGQVTILHNFGDGSVTNDGANPVAGLVEGQDHNFYGTTSGGGSAGEGTVFMITPGGTLTILHSFGNGSVSNDGNNPTAGLIQGLDGNFYGTTVEGGLAGKGTVFEINSQKVVTIVHSFGDGTVSNDGASPGVGLVQDSLGNFYGTTFKGGSSNQGAVFVINAAMQVSTLYSFSEAAISLSFSPGILPNGSGGGGYYPNSRLLLGSDGNLYGTTASSLYGYGSIFRITPQGQETLLHYFGVGTVSNDGQEPPNEGFNPQLAGENMLTQDADGNIYGTTRQGGFADTGVIFKITPDEQVTIVHSFQDGTVTNDGSTPAAGVIQGADGNFYGTTTAGGSTGYGIFFKVVPQLPEISSSLTVSEPVGVSFAYQALATKSPTSFSATGLPPGLSINSSTGLISGTPTVTGTSLVTLTVTNAAGSNSATLVISIVTTPVITSNLNAFGTTELAFPFDDQITATGNPTSFGAMGLPAGLTLNAATGVISGTPSATGTFSFTISATNTVGTGSAKVTLVVTATVPTLSQEYELLHSFNDGSVTNEGIYPGEMIQGNDGTFYGVTAQGGGNGYGTVFNLSAAGTASVFSNLTGTNGSIPQPQGLVQGYDGNFYGTTQYGGTAGNGTLFKVTPAGVITVLHNFGDGSVTHDGANPQAEMIQAFDGNFYGTTQYGGSVNLGTVFKMTPQGVVTILHSFGDSSVTNDGTQSVAALLQLPGGMLYGTTESGGSAGHGTVFAITPQGVVSILHSFGDGTVTDDGWLPHAPLVPYGSDLAGTTFIGGSVGKGTLFQITTGGSETILHSFDDTTVKDDGINPIGHLVGGANLYGTTQYGGSAGEGTVFAYSSNSGLTIIHNFGDGSVTNDGLNPVAGLFPDAEGNPYGTTPGGGGGYGSVFAMVSKFSGKAAAKFPASYWSLGGALPLGMSFSSATGAISGTPLATDTAGAYPVTITLIIDGHPSTTEDLTINLGAQTTQTFNNWEASYAIASPAIATPEDDGVPNLLKYLYDINPTVPMSTASRGALPAMGVDTTTAPGSTYLTLTYRQYAEATGVTVNVQTSPDLQTWKTVTPDINQQIGTDPNTGDPVIEVEVKTGGSTREFIRLNVTSP